MDAKGKDKKKKEGDGAKKEGGRGGPVTVIIKEKIHKKVEEKTRKVKLIFPKDQPKKHNPSSEKNDGDKRGKQATVRTVVLKTRLDCDGCKSRTRKTLMEIKGVESVELEADKDLVTVKGTMDVKRLLETLKEKLKRSVEIVQVKKKDSRGGGDEKKKGGGGDEEMVVKLTLIKKNKRGEEVKLYLVL